MSAPVGGFSRRRVMQGAAWSVPAIIVATAVPAAAVSGSVHSGSFVRITSVELNNQTGLRLAGFNFSYDYSVYNDQAAFSPTPIPPYQAAADPAFASWATTWLLEVVDSGGAVVYSTSGNAILLHGQAFTQPNTVITLPKIGIHTARLTVTSSQVAVISGVSFALTPVTKNAPAVLIT